MALASAGVAAQPAKPSFCERMAAELGLKPTTDKKYFDGRPTYRINKLGGIGPMLFGGSSFITLQIGSEAIYGPEDYSRLSNACQSAKSSFVCSVSPTDFIEVGLGEAKARFDAGPDEHAEVQIVKASVICRDGAKTNASPS